MKTYVITVSRYFPQTHERAGQPTYFIEQILSGQKIHTIRGSFELWSKRIKEVQDGKAILSLRYWSGKPYNSKQVEFKQLDKDSGVGIQDVYMNIFIKSIVNNYTIVNSDLAENDGLKFTDFCSWFEKYDMSQMYAIIHFTKFRY